VRPTGAQVVSAWQSQCTDTSSVKQIVAFAYLACF
jgi:hypothetical protein